MSQLRDFWLQTGSFLMDGATLEKYRLFVVAGTPSEVMILGNLSERETAVYQQLAANKWRLEQERIRQEDVVAAICRCLDQGA